MTAKNLLSIIESVNNIITLTEGKMKITNLKIITANKYLFIKLETDKGIIGLGEAGAWGFLEAVKGVLNKFKVYLIGKDPFKIEDIWNYLYRSMYFRGSVIMSAISAIDIALWDIKGKALGVPIYQLLGGPTRNKVRVYDAILKFTPSEIKKELIDLKSKGFTAARILITGNSQKNADYSDSIVNSKITKYVERVKLVRELAGDNFDIILECHRSLSLPEAMSFVKQVEKYHPMFIEDPIAPDNFEAMSLVASKTNIPIATGERFINIEEFNETYFKHAAIYVRPDVCALGGITAAKKVAAISEANYGQIVPHNPLGPVSTAACLQIDASVPNLGIQEFPSFYRKENEAKMLKEPFEVKDGYIKVPDKPGLGIELNEEALRKMPEAQRSLNAQRAFDGSVCDI